MNEVAVEQQPVMTRRESFLSQVIRIKTVLVCVLAAVVVIGLLILGVSVELGEASSRQYILEAPLAFQAVLLTGFLCAVCIPFACLVLAYSLVAKRSRLLLYAFLVLVVAVAGTFGLARVGVRIAPERPPAPSETASYASDYVR
jgi:hypothetical protein